MSGDQDSVVAAVRRDLEALGSDELAGSALAMAAIELGRQMDGSNSATSKAMCAKSLADLLERLRELAPVRAEEDTVDDIAAVRARRRTA